jgi:hypothetical protein
MGFCKALKIKSGEVGGMRFPNADDQFFAWLHGCLANLASQVGDA